MNNGKDSNHHRRSLSRPTTVLDFHNLKIISAVGRGAKGVVFLTKEKTTEDNVSNNNKAQWIALKLISKALLQKKNKNNNGECKRVLFEQQILRRFDHPLLPRLRGVLETEQLTGYAIDFCHGGNMHTLRKKQSEKTFSEEIIRFYAVELVLVLEYLHKLGVVYRDLKPENIMIQETGHIMLVDFDLSKKLNPITPQSLSHNSSPNPGSVTQTRRKKFRHRLFSRFYYKCNSGIFPYDSDSGQLSSNSPIRSESNSVEKSNSFVGTEDYVAPEVISGNGHNFGVDWWSLGVVLYEMLYGTTPFKGTNRKDTFIRILSKEPDLTGETTSLRDLISKMLEKDPDRRIDVDGIKGHDFFKGVKWDTVLEIARPPYIPHNEVEDRKGFSKIEVELFIHGLFFPNNENGEKNKEREKKECEGENGENNNKHGWVDKLNQNPNHNEAFLVF